MFFFNQIKTILLLGGIGALLVLSGRLIGGQSGALFALAFSALMCGISYYFSDKVVLSVYGAKPLDTSRYGRIEEMVSELAAKARLPMPKLYLIDHSMANAFATGRNPANSAIAVTTGILNLLNESELRAVLAHEMSHIKNRDILIASVAATVATAISYLASMARWSLIFGGSSNSRERGNNPIVMLVSLIVLPIATTLVQLAISRTREYHADECGAELCRQPLALANALTKIKQYSEGRYQPDTPAQEVCAALFISNPFKHGFFELFQTHPATEKRVARLEGMFNHRNF